MKAQPSQAPVTLRDVARQLNVSHVTVSRALRDSPKVSAVVRQKVKRVAAEMGYRPNPMARGLTLWRNDRAKRTIHSEIAWLNHWRDPKEWREKFHTLVSYWNGAVAAAEQQGYRLEEYVVNTPAALKSAAQVLRARNILGILIQPGQLHVPGIEQDWNDFPWQDFSVVSFGRRIPEPRFHTVTWSQVGDCVKACEQVAKRGYERVGFVTHAQGSEWSLIVGGFLMFQDKLKPSRRVRPFLIREGAGLEFDHWLEREQLQKEFAHWLEREQPDAILTNIIAIPQALQRAGYSVPKDIGLATLNVSDVKADAGIYQFPEQTGQIAVETLLSLIYHNHRGIPKVPREVLVCGEWQDGNSLPPKASGAKATGTRR